MNSQAIHGSGDTKSQVLQLIDFLAEYDAQRNKPVRNVNEYRQFLLRESRVPQHAAVQLVDNDGEWLGVDFVELPKPPAAPQDVIEYVRVSSSISSVTLPYLDLERPQLEDFLGETESDDNSSADDVELEFEDALGVYEARLAVFNSWLQDVWTPWAETYRLSSEAKNLHRDLFEQREKLNLDRESVELVWGFGRARWNPDGYPIDHPLVTVSAEITMNMDTQRISVSPAASAEIEISYLAGAPVHDKASIMAIRQSAVDDEIDPWDFDGMSEILLKLARAIDDNGTVVAVADGNDDALNVDPSWSLFVRPRVPDSQGFLNDMREIYLADGVIPAPLGDIVSIASMAGSNIQATADQEQEAVASLRDEPLLLPLETNEQQKRILELAQRRPGVTVQGPPGTGKSHTIANLISHYVAYGQRVLVVAEKEQALKVLADKVPSGIRDLTVSVLGADEESRRSLEKSVTTIQSKVGTMDTQANDREIARLRARLDEVNRGIVTTTTAMLRARESETDTLPGAWIAGTELTPQSAAEWVRMNGSTLDFIPDQLEIGATSPFSETEYVEFLGLLDAIGYATAAKAVKHLPDTQKLPSSTELGSIFAALAYNEQQFASVKDIFVNAGSFMSASPEDVRATGEAIAVFGRDLKGIEDSPYVSAIAMLDDRLLCEEIATYHKHLSKLRKKAILHRGMLMSHAAEMEIPATIAQFQALLQVHSKLANGTRLGMFDRAAKKTLAGFKIDGKVPDTADEAQLCLHLLELDLARQSIVTTYRNQSPTGLRTEFSARPEDDVADEINSLERVFGLPDRREDLVGRLAALGIRHDGLQDAMSVGILATQIRLATGHFEAELARKKLDDVAAMLQEGAKSDLASSLWNALHNALIEVDGHEWDGCLSEINRLETLRPSSTRFLELYDRGSKIAPKWLASLEVAPSDAAGSHLIVAAWQWRQLEGWISSVTALESPFTLQSRLEDLNRLRRNVVSELVEVLAWRRLKENLGPKQHLALQSYLKAVTRYGKTGGKYAQRWIREMRESLNDAKDAVPVWIMTTTRALASFRPSEVPPFDVLIVDEASQIGFEALPLLSLAKKAIVVGDDKQTSPEHVGLDRQRVFDIMDNHLSEVPKYRTLFDPDNSLYDLATQKFASPVMLTEHFRCLPEIIAFSNVQAYNRQIVPLREDAPSLGWAALGALRVMDGYREGDVNEPEANQVANLISQMCVDKKYDGMTFGVVTLLGSSQAKLIWEKIYDQLGPEQIQQRKIRCGEAANFQGDERDVIIISTVIAPDPAATSTRFGAMTGIKDLRKINVAASRARNQMWVVTSVDPEMLSPGDYRAALIRHCSSQTSDHVRQNEILENCESEFERRVVNDLMARGYQGVEVQRTVGSYRLDIVVSGPHSRLAVECDGDRWHGPDVWHQDRSRQEVLERSGWTFERVRGSAYFRDPELAMQPIWTHLEKLGIPTGSDWMQVTESSTVREVSNIDLPQSMSTEFVEMDAFQEDSRDEGIDESLEWTPDPERSFRLGQQELDLAVGLDRGSDVVAGVLEGVPRVIRSVPQPEKLELPGVDSSVPLADASNISLSPYRMWSGAAQPPVSDRSIRHIQSVLVEILHAEGPMVARDAHLRYQQAAGGQRIGKALQSIFDIATNRAVKAGDIAQIVDGTVGIARTTLYVPGTEPVVMRTLGPRTLFDVPKSEVLSVMELLRLQGVDDHDLNREVLNIYKLKKLTERTTLHLNGVRDYSWER